MYIRGYFIIEAVYSNGDPTYVANTQPLDWTDNRDEAKQYQMFRFAKSDILSYNYEAIEKILRYTDIKEINVLQIIDNEVYWRENIL